jgi:uncharacterized membrane protein YGL010W
VPIVLPVVSEAVKSFPVLNINFGFILMILLLAYYVLLNVTIGVVMSIEFTAFYVLANFLEQSVIPSGQFVNVCIAVQVFMWGIQFIGHGVFEGRRPALMDNLLQVFIAPMFVMLEYLFLLGICSDLEKEIHTKAKSRELLNKTK